MNPANPPAVAPEIALAKVRYYLAGLRGYSPRDESIAHLARVVQSACVSVDHADEVLSRFDDECPTPREIKEVALNLRSRFLPPEPSLYEKWRKEYGPPDPAWSQSLIQSAPILTPGEKKAEFYNRRIQALKDAVYYSTPAGKAELNAIIGDRERRASKEFWGDAIARDRREYPEQWAAIQAGREPEFNEPRPKVLPMRRPIITAESFQGVEPMHIERCHNCGGSGRLAGDDYCDECQTGRDLRKLEYSSGPSNGTEH
jgi:hypothetical protein